MSEMNTKHLERALEEIQHLFAAPHQSQTTINMVQIVPILFEIARKRGQISGKWEEDNRIHFHINNDAPRIYEFPKSAFRSLLAAIANFARLQSPDLPDNEKFNFYGDNQEIPYMVDGSVERFHLETLNNNGKLYFVLRRL